MPEPIYFIVERAAGGDEVACIYRDRLLHRITRKIPRGSSEKPVAIYQLRVDKLPPDQQQFWLSKSCDELLHVYRWLRDEGTLPPSNLAEPPREKPQQGRELGNWWTQPVPPWPQRPPDPLPDPEQIGPRK